MFPPFAKLVLICIFGFALVACSSSPEREEAKTSKQVVKQDESKKTGAKKSNAKQEAQEATIPDVPVGPPPIPPEATQRFENALTLLGAGDTTRAEPELKRLAEAYPQYSGALANLGILYLKTGKLMEAEKVLHAATERSPDNAMAFNQLGIVYRKLGRFKEADAAYTKAIAADPSYALAHLNLGVLCDLYLQQPDRALAAFERYSALATKPDARVASWIKELQARAKSQRPEAKTQ